SSQAQNDIATGYTNNDQCHADKGSISLVTPQAYRKGFFAGSE
ncbi:hypothetical protein HMPREF9713_03486, partial [Myroides odoratimimus CCUG 12700]